MSESKEDMPSTRPRKTLPTEYQPEILHGWYSETQKKRNSKVFIYLNKDGKEVEVTEVQQYKEMSAFEDAEYVGICIKWVRSCPFVFFGL